MHIDSDRKLRVFLCHASQDKPIIRKLYQRLNEEGWIEPWLDEKNLIPGQDWKLEVTAALNSCDVVIVCLSTSAITKEGFVQREINFALEKVSEKPEGTIFLIPVRLEECGLPSRLSRLHWVDIFHVGGYESLVKALSVRALTLNVDLNQQLEIVEKTNAQSLVQEEEQPIVLDIVAPVAPRITIQLTSELMENKVWGGIEFVKVPKGLFVMGSRLANKFANPDENPQHTVDISYDFWMGRFLVTNEQFAEFIELSNNSFKWSDYHWKDKLNYPVEGTSWEVINAYLIWLNKSFGNTLPTDLTFRLPTEAEWEKTSRGTDGREWPWGNKFDKEKCNSRESNRRETVPVGFHSPNGDSPYGCADMVGNLWQWTYTFYRPYPYNIDDGRDGGAGKLGDLVCRGGSFHDDALKVRVARRELIKKTIEYKIIYPIGIRLVVAPRLRHHPIQKSD